jgi:hypothetical protein
MSIMRSLLVLIALVHVGSLSRASFISDVEHPVDVLPFAYHDDLRILDASLFDRHLQTVVAQPATVCATYNKALAGLMTCTCQRFGSTDVQIYCIDIGQTCVADNSSCFVRSILTIITSDSKARVTTTCTNNTLASDLNTCVQIFPQAQGDFSGLQKCTATLNGNLCRGCSECVDHRNATTNSTSITVNCCNVKPDAIQTCAQVGALGSFLSYYDAVPAGKVGTCPSGAAPMGVWGGLLVAAVTSSVLWNLLS